MRHLRSIAAAALCLALAGSLALAATTGKLVGTVIDADTREPLPGAVVTVLGTAMGANTDLDGRYIIVNVPVGTYSVQARMMGYEMTTMTNVRVLMDLTTTNNFRLKPGIVTVGGIEIVAERKMVIKDATTTTRVTSAQEIMAMPAASTANIAANTAGAVSSGGAINIRGGRSDEMVVFIDGVSVTNALTGAQGAQVNPAAIQEVMVITGGFNAEYGEAMSGVMNVVTKEGGAEHSAFVKYTTDEVLMSNSRGENRIEASFGGPVPAVNSLNYFLSGELRHTDDFRPAFMPDKYWTHDPDKDYFWADTLYYSQSEWDTIPGTTDVGWVGEWADSIRAGNVEAWEREKARRIEAFTMRGWKEWDKPYLPHGQYQSYRLQGKLSYKVPGANIRISAGGLANRDQRELYTASYKYHLDSYYSYMSKARQGNFTWRHQISNKTFYNIILNHFYTTNMTGVKDTTAEKDRKWWQDYIFLSDADANGDSVYDAYAGQSTNAYDVDNPYGISGIFYTAGLARLWEKTYAKYNAAKFDVTSQVDNYNMVQGGVDFKLHEVYLKSNSLPWDPEPFKDYYLFKPVTGAAYLQDKLEFEGFIVNAGLRFDYLNSKAKKKVDNFNLTDTASFVDAKPKYKLSPRLGISHPITERTVLHVSYGHFFQQPQLQYLYESLQADITRGNSIMGDPDLGVQRTIAYEAGFSHQFADDIAGDVTIFYKDIFDLMGTRFVSDTREVGGTGLSYTTLANAEYGNSKGLELTLQKRPGKDVFSGRLAYTMSLAKGTASDAFEGYSYWFYYMGTDPATGQPYPNPANDNFLEFDQRHTISVSTNFDFDDKFGPALGKIRPLANVSLSLLTNIGSGLPYTRKDSKQRPLGDINGARMPWTWNSDLMLTKGFNLFGVNASLNMEMFNVFNRKNTRNVFAVTGDPMNDGRYITINDFSATPTPDSVAYTWQDLNGNGFVDPGEPLINVPNPYYSKWRDLDGDGEIDQNEKYITFLEAWKDYTTDPYCGGREPSTQSYDGPRRMRLFLTLSF
ncbi:MAG TPA: hypothetical protein DDW31_04285 [candidate division Zixibacteria bacterium]|nr:hypothetical protein [candidate division Zixibacteria bacterium]